MSYYKSLPTKSELIKILKECPDRIRHYSGYSSFVGNSDSVEYIITEIAKPRNR